MQPLLKSRRLVRCLYGCHDFPSLPLLPCLPPSLQTRAGCSFLQDLHWGLAMWTWMFPILPSSSPYSFTLFFFSLSFLLPFSFLSTNRIHPSLLRRARPGMSKCAFKILESFRVVVNSAEEDFSLPALTCFFFLSMVSNLHLVYTLENQILLSLLLAAKRNVYCVECITMYLLQSCFFF